MNFVRLCILVALVFSIPNVSSAAVLLDQSNLSSYSSVLGSSHFQQQITAGMSGILDHINLYTSAGTVNIRVKMGNAVQTSGPWLFDQVLTFVAGVNSINLSALGISVEAGDTFVVDWNGAPGGVAEPLFGFSFTYANPDYAGGALWKIVNGVGTMEGLAGYTEDMRFQTYIQERVAVHTPEPATMLLMGIGVAGAAFMRKRKMNTAN